MSGRRRGLTAQVMVRLTPAELQELDELADAEERTRSGLIRLALRRYLANAPRSIPPMPSRSDAD